MWSKKNADPKKHADPFGKLRAGSSTSPLLRNDFAQDDTFIHPLETRSSLLQKSHSLGVRGASGEEIEGVGQNGEDGFE